MKHVLLLLLGAMVSLEGCDLFNAKDPKPKTELEKLPPITQTGENTFGCLVNGKAFVVTNTLNMSAIYQGGGLALSGGVVLHKNLSDIQIFIGELVQTNTSYDLVNDSNKKGQYYVEESNCWFSTNSNFSGTLFISFLDRSKYFISGTFEFQAYSSDCDDIISITNGRFDMQYIP